MNEVVVLNAAFSAMPISGDAPLQVAFTDESTPNGVAEEWQWDFGDGGTSAVQHPVYTYTVPGTYTVTLTVTGTETTQSDLLVRSSYITVDFPASTPEDAITTTVTYDYGGDGNRLHQRLYGPDTSLPLAPKKFLLIYSDARKALEKGLTAIDPRRALVLYSANPVAIHSRQAQVGRVSFLSAVSPW